MISNQILQTTIDGLKSVSGIDISVLDMEGTILVSTEDIVGTQHFPQVPDMISSKNESVMLQGYQFFRVYDDTQIEYIIAVKGQGETSYKVGKAITFQIQNLAAAYKERYDKENFIKNLLLDNMLLVDIYSRAKKLRVENGVSRIVYLIESNNDTETNNSMKDIIRGLFPAKTKDFVTAVDEHYIILVKDVNEDHSRETIEKTARVLTDMLRREAMGQVRVAMGSVVSDLKDISRSYKEAKIALEVGKIFYEEKNTINYNRLGIGRLIYQLPISLCKMYIEEIFKDIRIEDFDEETLNTVNKFFENSLNISETSRQLYIHRNTLVYRLDKLQKNTGLDIRVFDDAITFKIALMVAKYMHYMEQSGY